MPRRPPRFKPRAALPSTPRPSELERKAFYGSRAWKRLRAAFLRANPLCRDCEAAGRLTEATTPHHIRERLERPDLALDPANLMALCTSCHAKRHKGKGDPGGW